MNQILEVRKNKSVYLIQLYISIIVIVIAILFFAIYKININNKEKTSKGILNNYSLSKLYSNSKDYYNQNSQYDVIGIIEIPKLNISYPIFSNISDDLLKISPCTNLTFLPFTTNIFAASVSISFSSSDKELYNSTNSFILKL